MAKLCYRLGVALDILHLPLAIAILLLGRLWLPKPFNILVPNLILVLQVICLGCPLNVVTCWLRRRYNPSYNYWGSVTFWLYHRYGRWVGVPIFIVTTALSYVLAGALLKH